MCKRLVYYCPVCKCRRTPLMRIDAVHVGEAVIVPDDRIQLVPERRLSTPTCGGCGADLIQIAADDNRIME